MVALAGGGLVVSAMDPDRAQAHHICGHTYTTNSCPHPYDPLTRVDVHGYPLHPTYGYAVDDEGKVFTNHKQKRSKTCEATTPKLYPFIGKARYGGGWTRCCYGRLRQIHDCCSKSSIRINGDGAVRGYCQPGLKVFCITYRELNKRC
jgi:hypothetical protein